MGFRTMLEIPVLSGERGFLVFDNSPDCMGLSGACLNRFRRRVDAVLDDFFPVSLKIGLATISGSGPGSKTVSNYMEGGEATNFRFPFRVPATSLQQPLAVGDALDWIISETRSIPLEVAEISERPHEERIHFVCKKRRVSP